MEQKQDLERLESGNHHLRTSLKSTLQNWEFISRNMWNNYVKGVFFNIKHVSKVQ
jgi:hypothetical protein